MVTAEARQNRLEKHACSLQIKREDITFLVGMAETPEQKARREIDSQLAAAGWLVQSRDELDLSAGRGVAVREFPMKSGFGFADYLSILWREWNQHDQIAGCRMFAG
jgi:hypothetical protein